MCKRWCLLYFFCLSFCIFLLCRCSTPVLKTTPEVKRKTLTESQAMYEIIKEQRARFGHLEEKYGIMGRFFNLIETEYHRSVSAEEMEEVIYEGIGAMLKKLSKYNSIMNPGDNIVGERQESCIMAGILGSSGIGYMSLKNFLPIENKNFTDVLKKEKKKMEEWDMKGLIIDLRNNGGGLVPLAGGACKEFLPKNSLIMSISRSRGLIREDYYNVKDNPCKYPVIILVNGETASAAELFAGALQYHSVAKLMGRETYGKGFLLNSTFVGNRVILFVFGEYLLPSGESVEGRGLKPDIELSEEITNSDKIIDLAIKEIEKTIEAAKEI